MKFCYKNIEYSQTEEVTFDFPSIHLNGLKDSYFNLLTCHQLFKTEANPKVINFDDGHRFPRCIGDEGFTALKVFVKEQFNDKNGDERGFEVDYEKYNFEVRF